jgi:hypothetical protein
VIALVISDMRASFLSNCSCRLRHGAGLPRWFRSSPLNIALNVISPAGAVVGATYTGRSLLHAAHPASPRILFINSIVNEPHHLGIAFTVTLTQDHGHGHKAPEISMVSCLSALSLLVFVAVDFGAPSVSVRWHAAKALTPDCEW